MNHLSPETFVDLLDGALAEPDVPHLGSCEVCRNQLAQLRAALQMTVQTEMPEPSPLFWGHLSSRVREDIRREAEQSAEAAGWTGLLRFSWWRLGGLVSAAAAAVALVVSLQTPRIAEAPGAQTAVATPSSVASVPNASGDSSDSIEQDEPLGFVADLASSVDWDDAAELVFSTPGDVDRSLVNLDEGERVELQRLLHEALGSGA
ncbi:MAG: hypothetical protein ABMA15_21015 [Vicinamibacterales bacterium]